MNAVTPDWNQIVEKHGTRVFRVAMRILGSIPDAEDVAQETFVEAYRLHRLEPIQSWTGLLVRLSTFRALDALRRRRPTVELPIEDCASHSQPIDTMVAAELASRLRQSVSSLPEQQATVFVLTCYEQWSRDEIAVHLGITHESVSTSLYKARKQLANLLNLHNPGELS